MEFRVLGPLEVLDASGRSLTFAGAKERAILAALLLARGEVVSTDRLIDLLWPEDPPAKPANALQARISALRRTLGSPEVIATRSPGYRLAVESATVDAIRFEALLDEARANTDRAIAIYDQALAQFRGAPLAEFVYEDFARGEIARLEELRTSAREERIQLMLDSGRHAEVLGELEGLVVEWPLRERAWGQLMLALYRSGRQADALRAYRQAATTLGEELGIEPSPELRRLEEAILVQDPDLEPTSGERAAPGHNLRARLTSLVGRTDDIERVGDLLASHRLTTLTGPGGVGKTSLAIAIGQEAVPRFRDGVWFVELASVDDPTLVPAVIASDLGVEIGDRSTLDLVCEVLRDREVLLVLDNCEHLVDAVAEAAVEILQRAPGSKIIATSREPLGVTGEILWPTRPLPAPADTADPTDLESYDSVRPVRRARPCRAPRLRPRQHHGVGGGGHLPSPRRPPARHRTGRRPGAQHACERDRCPAR
jgi:DNA-binding SARP family transcriptional activator